MLVFSQNKVLNMSTLWAPLLIFPHLWSTLSIQKRDRKHQNCRERMVERSVLHAIPMAMLKKYERPFVTPRSCNKYVTSLHQNNKARAPTFWFTGFQIMENVVDVGIVSLKHNRRCYVLSYSCCLPLQCTLFTMMLIGYKIHIHLFYLYPSIIWDNNFLILSNPFTA